MKTFQDYIAALEAAPRTERVVSAIRLAKACATYPERTPETRICANGPTFSQSFKAALADAKSK